MGFHWGDGPSQINQVVTVGGSGSAPTTTPLTAAAKVEKKGSKAPIKTPPKDKATGARQVVAFELVFTSGVTRQQLTVRIPAVGAFHDPKRPTTIRDLRIVGKKIAEALNAGFHDIDKDRPR